MDSTIDNRGSKFISTAGVCVALCFLLYTFQRFVPVVGTMISLTAPLPLIAGAFFFGKRWLFETSLCSLFLIFLFNDLIGSLLFMFYFLGAVIAIYYHLIEKCRLIVIIPCLFAYNLLGEFVSVRLISAEGSPVDDFFKQYWFLFAGLMTLVTFFFYERFILIFLNRKFSAQFLQDT